MSDVLKVYKDKNSHQYSKGVFFLGPENVQEYFRNLRIASSLPIISVGSGNGVIEREIEKAFDIQMICVDPDPLSWSIETPGYRPPEYATIDDLILDRPELIENCNMFINWAYPIYAYDMDALNKMLPHNVVTVIDVGIHRGSGSEMFHSWMHHSGAKTRVCSKNFSFAITDNPIMKDKYNTVFQTWTSFTDKTVSYELAIVWLSKDIVNHNKDNILAEIPNSPLSKLFFPCK